MGIAFGHLDLKYSMFFYSGVALGISGNLYRELFFSASTLANLWPFSNFNAILKAIFG